VSQLPRKVCIVAGTLTRPQFYTGAGRELAYALVDLSLYPLGLVEGALEEVVGWLQPAPPPTDATPVVLVHGYGSIKSHFLFLQAALRRAGFAHVSSMNYNPLTQDVQTLSRRLVELIDQVLAETGSSKVHLVGHSLGGTIIRHAVEIDGAGDRVDTAVTVASPHGGSPFGWLGFPFGSLGRTGAQLRTGSGILRRIERAGRANVEAAAHVVRWVAYYSNTDVLVPARHAMLRLPGATNLLVKDEGHLSVLISPPVVRSIVAQLVATRSDRDRSGPAS